MEKKDSRGQGFKGLFSRGFIRAFNILSTFTRHSTLYNSLAFQLNPGTLESYRIEYTQFENFTYFVESTTTNQEMIHPVLLETLDTATGRSQISSIEYRASNIWAARGALI